MILASDRQPLSHLSDHSNEHFALDTLDSIIWRRIYAVSLIPRKLSGENYSARVNCIDNSSQGHSTE